MSIDAFWLFADVLYFGLVYIDLETESGAAMMYLIYKCLEFFFAFCYLCNIICKAKVVDNMALYVSSHVVSCKAYTITSSRRMLNSCGEITHPCLTPTVVLNHSVNVHEGEITWVGQGVAMVTTFF